MKTVTVNKRNFALKSESKGGYTMLPLTSDGKLDKSVMAEYNGIKISSHSGGVIVTENLNRVVGFFCKKDIKTVRKTV